MSDPRKFWSCGNVLDVLYHTFTNAQFGGYRNSPATGAAKKVEFLCVFILHAFERQNFSARFRHEGVNDFDALVYSCAPMFSFIRLPAIDDTTNCRSPKNGKILVLLLLEGDRINRDEIWHVSVHHVSARRTKFGLHR